MDMGISLEKLIEMAEALRLQITIRGDGSIIALDEYTRRTLQLLATKH